MKKIGMAIILSYVFQTLLSAQDPFFTILYEGDYQQFLSVKSSINDFNKYSNEGEAPLIVLLKGFLNYKSSTAGSTPLHLAVKYNDVEMVRLLLEHGALTSVWNNEGQTPVQLALKYGSYECVELLRSTPYIADQKEKDYTDLLTELLSYGAEINCYDNKGQSALMLAVRTCSLDAVKIIVENGADISYRVTEKSETALYEAVDLGLYNIVEYLLKEGAEAHIAVSDEVVKQMQSSENNIKAETNYLLPSAYNLKVIVYSDVSDPAQDRRCFYKVYIDKVEAGRTTIGLESQKKEYTATIENNRHLLSVEKYVLDEKNEKYVKLNNIHQPKPEFYYFTSVKDRITLVTIKHVIEGTSEYSGEFMKKIIENDKEKSSDS